MTDNSECAPRFVIFLNPEVIDNVRVQQVGRVPTAQLGDVSLRDEPAEAFMRLAHALDAHVVITNDGGPYDARDRLLSRNIRVKLAKPWCTDQKAPSRGTGIAKWREQHGAMRAMTVDRPGVEIAGTTCIALPSGAVLTHGIVDRALALLDQPRAS